MSQIPNRRWSHQSANSARISTTITDRYVRVQFLSVSSCIAVGAVYRIPVLQTRRRVAESQRTSQGIELVLLACYVRASAVDFVGRRAANVERNTHDKYKTSWRLERLVFVVCVSFNAPSAQSRPPLCVETENYCFDPSQASRNSRSALVSDRPVVSTGSTCRRGSSVSVTLSSCAIPRRRIDTRTLSPGRRRSTTSSMRLGPVIAMPSIETISSSRSRPAAYAGVSSMVGSTIRAMPVNSRAIGPIHARPGWRFCRTSPARDRRTP